MNYISKIVVASLTLPAFAVDSKGRDEFDYLAFSVNTASYSDLDFTPNINFTDLPAISSKADSEKLGGRLFYGYQFNRFFAIEGGLNLFAAKNFKIQEQSQGDNNTTVTTDLFSGGLKAFGADLRAVAIYPVTKNLYLKANVGAVGWRSELDSVSLVDNELIATTNKESGVSAIGGFGIAYGIKKTVAISLDVETTEISDIRVTNVGLSFTFRK